MVFVVTADEAAVMVIVVRAVVMVIFFLYSLVYVFNCLFFSVKNEWKNRRLRVFFLLSMKSGCSESWVKLSHEIQNGEMESSPLSRFCYYFLLLWLYDYFLISDGNVASG